MSKYILIEVFIYLTFFVLWVLKQQRSISNTREFLSVGSFDSTSKAYNLLGKTFEATNASFATTFVGLFTLAQINLFYALYIIIGYLLGIYLFAKIIIPRLKYFIENKIYYPQMIEQQSGSKLIGNFISVMVMLSLMAFFYTEIFTFSHGFLLSEETSVVQTGLISSAIVLLLVWYTTLGGYRNVVTTDFIQIIFIRIGVIALLAMGLYLLFTVDNVHNFRAIITNDYAVFPHLFFIPALMIGFVFAQVVYYDNWQRLIIFYQSMDDQNKNIHNFLHQASFQYIISIKYLLLIFSVPLFLALIAKNLEITSLYALLNTIWSGSLLAKLLVLTSVLAFISALLSTIDTYLLGSIQVLVNKFPDLKLQSIRLLIVFFTLGTIPFIFLKIDMGEWFRFLFYSANVLVGPVVLALLGIQLNKHILGVSLLIGLFATIFYSSSEYIDLIAALTIVLTIISNYLLRHKQKEDVYA